MEVTGQICNEFSFDLILFLMAKEEYSYVSSRLVKEVARLGGDVTGLVPESIRRRLGERVGKELLVEKSKVEGRT